MSTQLSDAWDDSLLPKGPVRAPVPTPHFPDALHTFIWRNWDLVPVDRLVKVVGGTAEQLSAIAMSMGLGPQRKIGIEELERSYVTLMRRNWHLLPYQQLSTLLGWTARQLNHALAEDDFLWHKLGNLKPTSPPVTYKSPDAHARDRALAIGTLVMKETRQAGIENPEEPFAFIERANRTLAAAPLRDTGRFALYPYFLRYGDPLSGSCIDDVPEAFLAQLQSKGINAIWLQALLNQLSPWELAPELSAGWEERIDNLRELVARAARYGVRLFIYLNEPRSMHPAFFDRYPHLRGVNEEPARIAENPNFTLCTSTPEIEQFITGSVRHVFEQVPGLGGAFTITYSENLTNCFSR